MDVILYSNGSARRHPNRMPWSESDLEPKAKIEPAIR